MVNVKAFSRHNGLHYFTLYNWDWSVVRHDESFALGLDGVVSNSEMIDLSESIVILSIWKILNFLIFYNLSYRRSLIFESSYDDFSPKLEKS